MVRKILVAVDGSKPSVEACHFAMDLAAQTQAELTFLFVLETPQVIPVGPLSGYVTTSPPPSEEDLKKARAIVEHLAHERPALKIATRVDLGEPVDTIVEVAKSLGVELLVVGARGHNAAQRFLLGSVSDRVVHHAPCPVLVVRR